MGIQKEVQVDQVLMFRSAEQSRFLGPALWSAMEEVCSYFNPVEDDGWLEVPLPTRSGAAAALIRPVFRKWYVAEELPIGFKEKIEVTGTYVQGDIVGSQLGSSSIYDHRKLGTAVSSTLDLTQASIMVDAEIEAPPNWRYVIWDWYLGGAVISMAPIDPRYWGFTDTVDEEYLLQEIKRGARAASMSVMGSMLGLSRCDNPRCFMFSGVDSVARLGEMLELGIEHRVKGLARGQFDQFDLDPNSVAAPHPMSLEES